MIKHNSRRFKRQNFLSCLPRARDYKYWFVKNEYDNEVKVVKITADEWFNAVNLMQNSRQAKLPNWLQRLKDKKILLLLINELSMVLDEYTIGQVQTTHFSCWGRKEVYIKDHFTFRNDDGFELYTDWWDLLGNSYNRICLSHETQDNSLFFLFRYKNTRIQVERILLAMKVLTEVVEVSSISEILDKFSHEQIMLELISDSVQYENDLLIYAEYDVLYNGNKYFLGLDFEEKYYRLSERSYSASYLSFDINCVSKYSLKEMYKLILHKL